MKQQISPSPVAFFDLGPEEEDFGDALRAGLSQSPKSLPCKYFYDERGSKLFDRICELDEYYLTRTEIAIMTAYAGEMAKAIGPDTMIVEYGSGSATKTRILLGRFRQ